MRSVKNLILFKIWCPNAKTFQIQRSPDLLKRFNENNQLILDHGCFRIFGERRKTVLSQTHFKSNQNMFIFKILKDGVNRKTFHLIHRTEDANGNVFDSSLSSGLGCLDGFVSAFEAYEMAKTNPSSDFTFPLIVPDNEIGEGDESSQKYFDFMIDKKKKCLRVRQINQVDVLLVNSIQIDLDILTPIQILIMQAIDKTLTCWLCLCKNHIIKKYIPSID